MSMAITKASFEELLVDQQVRVMALFGKWGTGKSHMWKLLRATSRDPEIKSALYVSLFGAASVGELKLKLCQSAMPLLEKKGPRADAVKGAINTAKIAVQSFFKLGSALDELTMLAIPALVRDKFIVIDDIERKHDKLAIDEVLGFIDDFTQNYGCRILLILNTDQLADKTVWDKFREKVIDAELRLDTTSAEAFDIAIQLSPSQFASKIQPAVEACGLTNIRIIRKIIRAVNNILSGNSALLDDVLNRMIPSTVLLSAIHYKGIEDGPTIAFVLDSQSSISRHFERRERAERGEEASDEDKLHARWELLLNRLNISHTDEYEILVSDYLSAGLVDRSAVDAIIGRYSQEQRRAGAQAQAREFIQSTIWDPELPPNEILKTAQVVLTDVQYLDCYTVTSLHDLLVNVEGGRKVAGQMITLWIEHLQKIAAVPGADPSQFELSKWTNQNVHPSIVSAFSEARGHVEQRRTLLDVILILAERDAWGHSDEAVIQAATIDDFKQTILSLRGEQLRLFLLKNMDLYANRNSYEKHFGSGPNNFLEACKRIRVEYAGTRWEGLIENVFKSVNLDADLNRGSTPPQHSEEDMHSL